jgi:hypothetical protein
LGKIESEECGSNFTETRQTDDVGVGSAQDRSSTAGKMGEGQAGQESGLIWRSKHDSRPGCLSIAVRQGPRGIDRVQGGWRGGMMPVTAGYQAEDCRCIGVPEKKIIEARKLLREMSKVGHLGKKAKNR